MVCPLVDLASEKTSAFSHGTKNCQLGHLNRGRKAVTTVQKFVSAETLAAKVDHLVAGEIYI